MAKVRRRLVKGQDAFRIFEVHRVFPCHRWYLHPYDITSAITTKTDDIDRDVNTTTNANWIKWRQISGTTSDPQMPKGKIYKSIISQILMYLSVGL